MKRIVLALVAAAVLASPVAAANCAKDYKDFWDNLDRSRSLRRCLPSRSPTLAARLCVVMTLAPPATSGSRPTTSSRSLIRKRTQRRRTSSMATLSGPADHPTRRSNADRWC